MFDKTKLVATMLVLLGAGCGEGASIPDTETGSKTEAVNAQAAPASAAGDLAESPRVGAFDHLIGGSATVIPAEAPAGNLAVAKQEGPSTVRDVEATFSPRLRDEARAFENRFRQQHGLPVGGAL